MSKVLDFVKLYYATILPELAMGPVLGAIKSVGSWDLNFGDAQESYLGSRFTYAFGADNRLVFAPLGWIMGPGKRNPIVDALAGLGDDVSFCYGGRTFATYGGPNVTINRGPRINKTGGTAEMPDAAPMVEAYRPWVDNWRDPLEAPLTLGTDDEKVLTAVKVLGVCLTLTTAVMDLWVHFKYETYDPHKGKWTIEDQSGDLSTELGVLQYTHRLLPRRLMALVYHIEMACTFKSFGDALKEQAKGTLKKLAKLMLAVSTLGIGLVLFEGLTKYGIQWTAKSLGIFLLILLILVAVVALILVLT